MDKKEKSKIGKKSRKSGSAFELAVKKDLIKQGWIVIKNLNNVIKTDTPNGQTIEFKQGKAKFNPFTKALMMSSGGFPDFVCFRRVQINWEDNLTLYPNYEVISVESKTTGYLDKEEKAKCSWLLDKQIFSKILIALKDGKEIKYKEFENEKE